MQICPVGAELFHAGGKTDGQTDMTTLTVAFRSCANAPKMIKSCRPKWNNYTESTNKCCWHLELHGLLTVDFSCMVSITQNFASKTQLQSHRSYHHTTQLLRHFQPANGQQDPPKRRYRYYFMKWTATSSSKRPSRVSRQQMQHAARKAVHSSQPASILQLVGTSESSR
jgi:hypothetical protein